MALYASWVHGNALTVQSPENLDRVGYFGWGADMLINFSGYSWFHIPIPTPVIVGDKRATVQKLFLLFKVDPSSGEIQNIHIYDGSAKVQEFNDLFFDGEHRTALDGQNTFNLSQPHTVVFGMGISFFFQAPKYTGLAMLPPRLIVASAGGDFLA